MVLGIGLIVAGAPALALAQANDAAGTTTAPHRDGTKIPEKIAPSGSSTEPLSKQLNRSGGVVRPPADIDPGIAQTPPQIGPQSTPVIPPPGSSGEDRVTPK